LSFLVIVLEFFSTTTICSSLELSLTEAGADPPLAGEEPADVVMETLDGRGGAALLMEPPI